MKSLKWRLNLGLLGSLVLVLLLFGLLLNNTVRHLSEELVASRLAHDAESLLAGLSLIDGRLSVDPQRVDAIYERPYSGHYYLILSEGERLQSRSLWDRPWEPEAVAPGRVRIASADGPIDQRLLIRSAGYLLGGRPLTLSVAEDISQIDANLAHFNVGFALLTVATLLGLAVLQSIIVYGSFRSIKRITDALQRLEAGQIERLPESVPTEVRPLVSEVNRLLVLMRRRMERSRNALGNLAHALKGPLNLLLREAPQDRLSEHPAERIRQLVDHELRRARIAGSFMPGRRFRPADELPSMSRLLQQVYPDRPLSIEWRADPKLELPFDRDDMLELLGNLADNACKWAESRVRISIDTSPTVRFTVEDDGRGCSGEEAMRMTERGARIDESVPGHGLGLSIVRDIADSYGAELRFDRSPQLGGLRVTVTFPSEARTLGGTGD